MKKVLAGLLYTALVASANLITTATSSCRTQDYTGTVIQETSGTGACELLPGGRITLTNTVTQHLDESGFTVDLFGEAIVGVGLPLTLVEGDLDMAYSGHTLGLWRPGFMQITTSGFANAYRGFGRSAGSIGGYACQAFVEDQEPGCIGTPLQTIAITLGTPFSIAGSLSMLTYADMLQQQRSEGYAGFTAQVRFFESDMITAATYSTPEPATYLTGCVALIFVWIRYYRRRQKV